MDRKMEEGKEEKRIGKSLRPVHRLAKEVNTQSMSSRMTRTFVFNNWIVYIHRSVRRRWRERDARLRLVRRMRRRVRRYGDWVIRPCRRLHAIVDISADIDALFEGNPLSLVFHRHMRVHVRSVRVGHVATDHRTRVHPGHLVSSNGSAPAYN